MKGVVGPAYIGVCHTHGSFLITGGNFICSGHGCEKCGYERLKGKYTEKYFEKYPDRKEIKSLLYYIEFSNHEDIFFKIGITIQSLSKRFTNTYGYKIKILKVKELPLYEAFKKERKVLGKYKEYQYIVPNKDFGGRYECFFKDVLTRFDF